MAKLSPYEFGRQLLELGDLDPVYVLVYNSELMDPEYRDWLYSWLLAYFCFYHMGTASWIAPAPDRGDYWIRMKAAAASKYYPRKPERRHFRGENARKSVAYLMKASYPEESGSSDWNCPSNLFAPIVSSQETLPLATVMKEVQKWGGFGPWIAFKVADVLERLGLVSISFDTSSIFLFDSPKQGAELMADFYRKEITDDTNAWALNSIIEALGTYKAPPIYERGINEQEAETILCKWKSYMKGHYHIGEDIEGCRSSLLWSTRTRLCQHFLAVGKEVHLW